MWNMSFALTTEQIRNKTKTVTRRMGWRRLKAGDLVRPVERVMGFRKGEKMQALGPVLRVVDVRREPLLAIADEGDDGPVAEGFPEMTPKKFVAFFCKANRGCTPCTEVTRIEFEYVEELT